MSGQSQHPRFANPVRLIGWGAVGALLLVPLIAMQFTSEVNWTASDFAVAAVLLGSVGLAIEGVLRISDRLVYRAAAAVAVLTAFFTVWGNLAVGFIGSENEPANLIYFAAIALGFLAAIVVRFKAAAMSVITAALAVVMVLAGAYAVSAGLGFEVMGGEGRVTLIVVVLWLASSFLFHRAARSPA